MSTRRLAVLVIGTATIAVTGTVIVHSTRASRLGPAMRIRPAHCDVGIFVRGVTKSRSAQFSITNEGSGELTIEKVELLCGCASGRLSRKQIPPRQSAELIVGVKDDHRSGLASAAVYVYSNERIQPIKRITLQWQVVDPVWCEPAHVVLRKDEKARFCAGEVTIVSCVPGMIAADDICGFECSSEEITARLETPSGTESHDSFTALGRILVEATTTDAIDTNRAWLKVNLSRDDIEPILVPIVYEEVRRILVEPPVAYFGFIRPGLQASKAIRIRSLSGEPFSILNVSPSDDSLAIPDYGTDPALFHEFTVQLNAPRTAGVFRANLEVQTDQQNILIPVSALVGTR